MFSLTGFPTLQWYCYHATTSKEQREYRKLRNYLNKPFYFFLCHLQFQTSPEEEANFHSVFPLHDVEHYQVGCLTIWGGSKMLDSKRNINEFTLSWLTGTININQVSQISFTAWKWNIKITQYFKIIVIKSEVAHE